MRHPGFTGGASWTMEDIPYAALAHERVRDDRRLFYLVTSASFIEITSDLYTQNLVEYFRHDREIADWLEQVWQKEEVQHGTALRRYVETAWPDFDWEAAYRDFLAAYAPLCTVDQLAATRALEMAARCVVETGTATFYRMLSERSREPVLKLLAAKISADEVRHYKHFYRWFLRYQAVERPSRAAVLRTLWGRAAEIDAEDAFCAFKAVFLARNPAGRLPEERLRRLPEGDRATRPAPLSLRHDGQDAAEAARAERRRQPRGVAGHRFGASLPDAARGSGQRYALTGRL